MDRRATLNRKGTQCSYSSKPILCQEGFCGECQIYLDRKEEEEKKFRRIVSGMEKECP